MTATEQFIAILSQLKTGELSLLRLHAGQALDDTVDGFDLFSGLWWPLRRDTPRAPRRSVAWLTAKLHASIPIPDERGGVLPRQLARCLPRDERNRKRFQQKFDEMLLLPLDRIEPALRWALSIVASNNLGLDWVKLTDDLSIWERESTRLEWAKYFLGISERGNELC